MSSDEEECQELPVLPVVNYKQKYRELKKHLHALINENECFQEELRKAQRNFVSISRDRSFLLDRILKYEKPTGYTDSDLTESSEEDEEKPSTPSLGLFGQRKNNRAAKKKKDDIQNGSSDEVKNNSKVISRPIGGKPATQQHASATKKPRRSTSYRKPVARKDKPQFSQMSYTFPTDKTFSNSESNLSKSINNSGDITDGGMRFVGNEHHHKPPIMTREEVERHLEARRKISPELELNTTPTVPAELFSQEAESDFDGSEVCDFVQLEEDGTSADMIFQ